MNEEIKDFWKIHPTDADYECLLVDSFKKGDSLFVESQNVQDPFLEDSKYTKSILLPKAFINSALELLKRIKESNSNLLKDSYLNIVLWNFRQYLELTMKESISSFENLQGQYKDDSNHSLISLWCSLYRFLDKEDKNLTIVNKLIREFDEIDPASTRFRYPYQKGKEEKKINNLINIDNLRTNMLKLYRFFEGVKEMSRQKENLSSI